MRNRRARDLVMTSAFCQRLRQAWAKTGQKQLALAGQWGGFAPSGLSRLMSGQAKSIPIDMLCHLALWAERNTIDLHWLLTGRGATVAVKPAEPVGQTEIMGYLAARLAKHKLELIVRPMAGEEKETGG